MARRIDTEPSLSAPWVGFLEALPVMAFAANADGEICFVNESWRRFTGIHDSVSAAKAWRLAFGHEEIKVIARALHADCVGVSELEALMRRHDKTERWVRINASPYSETTASGIRWHGTIVDIDRYKRSDAQLQDRDVRLADAGRRFRALAESIPVICWTADASGWIDWYNKRWYEYTGQVNSESEGWGWQSAHHPDDFLEVMKRWPHSITTGEPFEMEYRLRRHDGHFHWFLTRAEPMRDERGIIVRWYGSNIDIDAQKKALEKSQRVAETLQRAFLPIELPQRPRLRVDATYIAAEKDALIGGDWFDAVELPDGRIMISIGDVAGHGLEASLSVGRLRQTLSTLAFRNGDPAEILEEMDRILRQQDPDIMVTALIAFIDSTLSTLTFASAGHPPPMLATRGRSVAQSLANGGPPLGSGVSLDLVSHTIEIERDAVIAVYTDGMVEFTHDPIAGEEKLKAAVALMVGATNIGRPALAVQEMVFDGKPALDDAALLILQFSAVDASAANLSAVVREKSWRFHSSDVFTAHAIRHEIMKFIRSLATNHDEIFTAELVLGEVLANTAEHAPGLVEVEIDWTDEKPLLTVRDAGPGFQTLLAELPADQLDEGGRGMFLIHSLSTRASIRALPGYGTEVRVVLDVSRKSDAGDKSANQRGQAVGVSPPSGPL